ncbi:carboxymuconolactone decarboxylase family protein, partial [Streptomyces hydrogenans]
GLDEEFWARMTAHYGQAEIVELTMSLGSWLAFGRLNRVLGLDEVCVLPTG